MLIKISTSLILILIISGSIVAQEITINDLLKMNLNGSIKSINKSLYNIRKYNHLDSIVTFKERHLLKFNKNGRKTDYQRTNSRDSIVTHTKYIYDKNGNLIEELSLNTIDSLPIIKTVYQYNKSNQVVIEEAYDQNGLLIYKKQNKYNKQDSLIGQNFINYLDDKIDDFVFHSFHGGEIVLLNISDSSLTMDKRRMVSYGSIKTLINMSPVSFSTYPVLEYDKFNNIIKSSLYLANGNLLSESEFSYEYDQMNNWTKKMSPVTIELREIKYYE